MKFKNILNKPYKYIFLYKYNKYYNLFTNINKNYFKLLYMFNINTKQLKKIKHKFSYNLYKSFKILKSIKFTLNNKLVEVGLTKTMKQSKYLIIYEKILLNGILCKNSNIILNIGDCLKIIPTLYTKNLYNNLFFFKNYLLKSNQSTSIIQNNILNINKNIFYVFKR